MSKYVALFMLITLLLLLTISTSNAQKVNLNFKELPLQSQACNYLTPQDIRTAYNFNPLYNNQINGNGESIAIVVAYGDPSLQQDVNTYDSYYNLPALNLNSNLLVEYPFGKPSSSYTNWTDETALDVEIAHALAPNAKIYLMVAPNDSFLFQTVNYTVENVNANIISMSWGSSELGYDQDSMDYFNKILANGQKKGINIFVASGDSGAYNGYNSLNVNFPASSPDVIAVGGTTLSIYSNGTYKSELGWNGSGGGKSEFFQRPSFQPDISSYRMVPDVSFNSGTPVCIYVNSQWDGFYGTSVAAPSWAALDSLINQNANGDISYLNKELYYEYNNLKNLVFHNITSGCNGFYCSDGRYNEVTGLGSPKAFQLVQAISNTSFYIDFNDPTEGVFSINGKNYSSTVILKIPFGEKINLVAYSNSSNSLSEKSVFLSFSGIINSTSDNVSFFVDDSGKIDINFNRLLRVEEYSFNGVNNKTYYLKNGSNLEISAPLKYNYSNYQYILKGFTIDNGTLIQKDNYSIPVLYPLNISYSWFKQPKETIYFKTYKPSIKANVSYYSHIPLSNSIKKIFSIVFNGSYIYPLANSTVDIHEKPLVIGVNRYLILNKTQVFSKNLTIGVITEDNYTIRFISQNGTFLRPKSFYVSLKNESEIYKNNYIWAPINTEVTVDKIDYDNFTFNKSFSFYSNYTKNINITLPVFDSTLKVVTILGIPVVGAKVKIHANNITFINSTNLFGTATLSNIPDIKYNATISAFGSTFQFKGVSGVSNTLSIVVGLYDLYIIFGVIVIILITLLIYERLKHRKHK